MGAGEFNTGGGGGGDILGGNPPPPGAGGEKQLRGAVCQKKEHGK